MTTTFCSNATYNKKYSIDPSHFLSYSPTPRTPERKLLAATLERGIKDAAGMFDIKTEKPRVEQSSALLWVLSADDEPWSFRWVCDELDMDPGTLKAAILRAIHLFKAENRTHVFQYRHRTCTT